MTPNKRRNSRRGGRPPAYVVDPATGKPIVGLSYNKSNDQFYVTGSRPRKHLGNDLALARYRLAQWQAEHEGALVWRASLQSARTGQRRGFASLAALYAFLEKEMAVVGESEQRSLPSLGQSPGCQRCSIVSNGRWAGTAHIHIIRGLERDQGSRVGHGDHVPRAT